jgi:hypothetical protein
MLRAQRSFRRKKNNIFIGENLHEHFMNYHVNFLVIFMTDTLYSMYSSSSGLTVIRIRPINRFP